MTFKEFYDMFNGLPAVDQLNDFQEKNDVTIKNIHYQMHNLDGVTTSFILIEFEVNK